VELNGAAWQVEPSREGDCFRWGKLGGEFVAEWQGLLALRATPDGKLMALEEYPGASATALDKIRNGGARAFLRSLAGEASLHASAVERDGEALLCVGASGAGKSTLAGSLCRSQGFRLLADDIAAVDWAAGFWEVGPTESRVWLLPEDRGTRLGKVPTEVTRALAPARLTRVVALHFDDSLTAPLAQSLRGARAFATLTRAAVRFHASPSSMKRELEVTAGLMTQVNLVEFARPRSCGPSEAAHALRVALFEGEKTPGRRVRQTP
jgi:hypothetical protein